MAKYNPNDPNWDIRYRAEQAKKAREAREVARKERRKQLDAMTPEEKLEYLEEERLKNLRDSGDQLISDMGPLKRKRLRKEIQSLKNDQLLDNFLSSSNSNPGEQQAYLSGLMHRLGGDQAWQGLQSKSSEDERNSLYKAGSRNAKQQALQALTKKVGGKQAEDKLLAMLSKAPGQVGLIAKALAIAKKPWLAGLQLVITLILIGLIVFLIAVLFNAYTGRSGTTPPQAGDINDPDFIDRLTLQKCLDEKPIQADEEQQAGPPLSIECQQLIIKLQEDGAKEITNLRNRIQSFEDEEKEDALTKLSEMEAALSAVKNSNGTLETLKQAIIFEEKRQEFLTAFYALIDCDNVEAIFPVDDANPGFHATPPQPVGNLARYANSSYDQHEWYVTKDFACHLIKVSQAFGSQIELGEGSGRGGVCASGHNTHCGGGVIDIWVDGFHSGSTPARARELAKIIMDLDARYLIVGSYQQSLESIQGVDADPSGVHDDHWHICFSGC